MNPVRLAIVGAGVIGRRHVEIAHADPHCELVALCDANPECRALAEPQRLNPGDRAVAHYPGIGEISVIFS